MKIDKPGLLILINLRYFFAGRQISFFVICIQIRIG